MKFESIKESLIVTILLIVTFFTYFGALNHEFLNFDDQELILKNPYIKDLDWVHIKAMFSNFYWFNYQPLTLLSFSIENHFWGMDSGVMHFNNIILHLCNILLVFTFIRKLSGRFDISIITAMLFALHPTRVESVAWATERKDVLYTLFFLLSINHYTTYIKRGFKNKFFIYSFFFFLLSCFTKGMAVSLTLVLFVIDFYFKRKIDKRYVIEKLPYIIVSIVFGILVTSAVQSEDIKLINQDLDISERLRLASLGFLQYFKILVYPFNLCSFHSYPDGITIDVPASYYIYPVLAVILTIGVIFTLRFSRKILFGYAFMVATIVMVLQLYITNNAFIADHYTYIPYIGIFYLCGELFVKLKDYAKNSRTVHILFIFFFLIIGGVYAFTSKKRVEVWKDSLTLWNDVVDSYPNSAKSYNGRGYCYVEKKEYRKAIIDYTKSIELNPNVHRVWYNRGNVYSLINEKDSAYADYMQSIELNPNDASAFNNLGVLLKEMKQYEKAIKAFDASIYLDNKVANVYNNKAYVLIQLEEYAEATTLLKKSISLDPYNIVPYNYLTSIYLNIKDCENASLYVEKGLSLKKFDGKQYLIRAEYHLKCSHDTDKACLDIMRAAKLGVKEAGSYMNQYCVNPNLKVSKVLPIKTKKGKTLYYDNGKIMLETIDTMRKGKNITLMRYYHPNGKLKEEGIVDSKTGKYNGEIKWYYRNGKDSIVGFYNDKTPFGKWKEFYPNGKTSAEYTFENGMMHGNYICYYDNGKIWTEREYRNGLLWNIKKLNSKNGNPLDYGTIKDGSGTLKVYDENGKLVETLVYSKGKAR